MTVRSGAEHLKDDIHLAAAEHEDSLEKTHREIAKIHRSMHKAPGMTDTQDGPHAQLAEKHDHLADTHKTYAAHHRAAAAKCEKVAVDALNKANELQPTEVSAIAPDRPNIRPIVRTGGAPFKTTVDPQLAKIVGGLREEDWNTDEPSLH
jgi:hypothetical protein